MPWLSQAQQTLGTGPAAQQRPNPFLGGPGAMGGGMAQPTGTIGAIHTRNPFQIGQDFSRVVGGLPTHTVLQQVNAGQSPVNSQPPSAPAPAAKPSASPEQAGAMNAAVPGAFNGNPANGFSGAEMGFVRPQGSAPNPFARNAPPRMPWGGGSPTPKAPAPMPQPQFRQLPPPHPPPASTRAPMPGGPGADPMPGTFHGGAPFPMPMPPVSPGPIEGGGSAPNPFANQRVPMSQQQQQGTQGLAMMPPISDAPNPMTAPPAPFDPLHGPAKAGTEDARQKGDGGREPAPAPDYFADQQAAMQAFLAQNQEVAQALAGQGASIPGGGVIPSTTGDTTGGTGGQQGDSGGAGGGAGGGTTQTPLPFTHDNPATFYNPDGTGAWTLDSIRADERGDARFWAPKPDNFGDMSDAQRQKWMLAHYNPYATRDEFFTNSPDAVRAFRTIYPNLTGLGQLPSLVGWKGTPVTIPSNANVRLDTVAGGPYPVDDRVRPLLDATHQMYSHIAAMMASSGIGEDWFSTKEGNHAWNQYKAARTLLSRYGVTYDPVKDIPSGSGGDRGDGSVTTDRTPWNIENTDVMTKLPDIDKIPGDIRQIFGGDSWNKASPEEKAAMLEAMLEIYLTNEQLANKQKQINIYQPGYEQTLAANNPFRRESESMALDALQNPNPVDLQGIQNRTASDFDKSLEQSIQAASGASARRGIAPGSMAGVAGNLTADNRNALSRTLGEQTSAYQMADRQAMYDAIRNAMGVNQQYLGGELTAAQQLGALVGNPYAAAQNPYGSFPDTSANLSAIELQRQLARQGPVDDKSGLYQGIGTAAGLAALALI